MSNQKKIIRKNFRESCFNRDKLSCVMCGFVSNTEKAMKELDCHHITNPKMMPNGGYVKENGITLCKECHVKAEQFHSTGIAHPKYSVKELYEAISSSYEKAVRASKFLKP